MAANVSISGLRGLRRQLADLDDRIERGAMAAVEQAADAVRDEAQQSVRVDTGALRRGLKVFADRSNLQVDVGWRDPDLYYARYLEFGTSEVSADPVLTAAGEAERSRLPGRVTVEVRQEIVP